MRYVFVSFNTNLVKQELSYCDQGTAELLLMFSHPEQRKAMKTLQVGEALTIDSWTVLLALPERS